MGLMGWEEGGGRGERARREQKRKITSSKCCGENIERRDEVCVAILNGAVRVSLLKEIFEDLEIFEVQRC